MEGMFTGQTDPWPFISAAYTIGLLLLIGTPVKIFIDWQRSSRLLASLKQIPKS